MLIQCGSCVVLRGWWSVVGARLEILSKGGRRTLSGQEAAYFLRGKEKAVIQGKSTNRIHCGLLIGYRMTFAQE
jgi:hypothetical protein